MTEDMNIYKTQMSAGSLKAEVVGSTPKARTVSAVLDSVEVLNARLDEVGNDFFQACVRLGGHYPQPEDPTTNNEETKTLAPPDLLSRTLNVIDEIKEKINGLSRISSRFDELI